MEFIILGILFVAVLVFISSRIRRVTGRAFEPEVIETEEFSIIKPEGFIHPLNDKSEYAFEAYSREFGKKEAGTFRQAQAFVRVHSDFKLDENAQKIPADNIPEDQEIYFLESEKTENEVTVQTIQKIIEVPRKGKVYELKISALKEHKEDFLRSINEMLDSFKVK